MYDVRHVLRKAGLRSTYSGYNYLASAVALVLKDQEFYLKIWPQNRKPGRRMITF